MSAKIQTPTAPDFTGTPPARLCCICCSQSPNSRVIGNSLPNLHTHVIPRYADDPKPGWPFPFPESPGRVEDEQFRADLEALRA